VRRRSGAQLGAVGGAARGAYRGRAGPLVALVADACEALRSPRAVRKAVERYEKCWLPLLRKHKGKQLVPPVDVEFVG